MSTQAVLLGNSVLQYADHPFAHSERCTQTYMGKLFSKFVFVGNGLIYFFLYYTCSFTEEVTFYSKLCGLKYYVFCALKFSVNINFKSVNIQCLILNQSRQNSVSLSILPYLYNLCYRQIKTHMWSIFHHFD